MSAAYTAWYDYVWPRVPSASQGLIEQAIRGAAIEFCRLSGVYRHKPGAINVVGLTSTYTITPPATTIVQDFVDVRVNGKEIIGRSDAWLDEHVTDWRTTATGPARAWRRPSSNQIQLVPTPNGSITDGLVVECEVRPLDTSTEVPDVIFDDWRDAITAGALARLYLMPGMRWGNAKLAEEHASDFTGWCMAAGAQASRGGTREPLRTAISF